MLSSIQKVFVKHDKLMIFITLKLVISNYKGLYYACTICPYLGESVMGGSTVRILYRWWPYILYAISFRWTRNSTLLSHLCTEVLRHSARSMALSPGSPTSQPLFSHVMLKEPGDEATRSISMYDHMVIQSTLRWPEVHTFYWKIGITYMQVNDMQAAHMAVKSIPTLISS